MVLIQHSIDEFDELKTKNIIFKLPDQVINKIKKISEQVGSSDYIKTPQFKTDKHRNKRKKYKNQEITDEDWDTFRTFQATELSKKDGIDLHINKVKKLFNKINDNKYSDMVEEIIIILLSIKIDSDKNKIYHAIFKVLSSSELYSKLYAKICKILCNKIKSFDDYVNNQISQIKNCFDDFKYENFNDDYDKLCEFNNKNDRRRWLCLFYTNLCNVDYIDVTMLLNDAKQFSASIFNKLEQREHKELIEEIVEIIFIIMTNLNKSFHDNSILDSIMDDVTYLSDCYDSKRPGFSRKAGFRCDDIIGCFE